MHDGFTMTSSMSSSLYGIYFITLFGLFQIFISSYHGKISCALYQQKSNFISSVMTPKLYNEQQLLLLWFALLDTHVNYKLKRSSLWDEINVESQIGQRFITSIIRNGGWLNPALIWTQLFGLFKARNVTFAILLQI